MQIRINTDHNIEGPEPFAAHARGVVSEALDRFRDQIARVEVHISDTNSEKSGRDDKRCMMEARLEGRKPIAVTHEGATVEAALAGAVERLAKRLEHTLGRLSTLANRRTDPAPSGTKAIASP